MKLPKVAIFDLDDTLAPPGTPPHDSLLRKIEMLRNNIPVAIVTGAPFDRVQRDVLAHLSPYRLANIYVFTDCAAQCRRWHGSEWAVIYAEKPLSDAERVALKDAIDRVVQDTGLLIGMLQYGDRVVYREAGVTLSCLGTGAPQAMRRTWDPDLTRRKGLREAIQKALPEWNVYIGGLTSIDIARKGVSKARAILWLAENMKCQPGEMLYVGDALFPGGNDEVVIATGVQTRHTSGPQETEMVIDELLIS